MSDFISDFSLFCYSVAHCKQNGKNSLGIATCTNCNLLNCIY